MQIRYCHIRLLTPQVTSYWCIYCKNSSMAVLRVVTHPHLFIVYLVHWVQFHLSIIRIISLTKGVKKCRVLIEKGLPPSPADGSFVVAQPIQELFLSLFFCQNTDVVFGTFCMRDDLYYKEFKMPYVVLCINLNKFSHVTPFLHKLHWLPIYYCILFKYNLLTYEAINFRQPSYVSFLIKQSDLTRGNRLSISLSKLKKKRSGLRSSAVAAPTGTNSLKPLQL